MDLTPGPEKWVQKMGRSLKPAFYVASKKKKSVLFVYVSVGMVLFSCASNFFCLLGELIPFSDPFCPSFIYVFWSFSLVSVFLYFLFHCLVVSSWCSLILVNLTCVPTGFLSHPHLPLSFVVSFLMPSSSVSTFLLSLLPLLLLCWTFAFRLK